jgi:hypothetical protein
MEESQIYLGVLNLLSEPFSEKQSFHVVGEQIAKRPKLTKNAIMEEISLLIKILRAPSTSYL